jgi:DNA-binding NarL/FixJ family response regulator
VPYRIFVVDDHPVMLEGYRAVLKYEHDLETCGAAASGDEALAVLTTPGAECDLVVTDYRMPGMSGAELVRRLRACRPGFPAIVVSAHVDPAFAREAMAAGAVAFVQKRDMAAMLVPTIRAVLAEHRRVVPRDDA